MSITIELDLPETVAAEARAKGLLDPQNLTRLIEREVKAESARRDFFDIVRELRALPGEPMTMEEIQAEVDAVRAERAAHPACP
ncbi:MAG: cytochrome P450 [Verrucomicrobia bacterium]|nr:cytochrome P450 [Verrucomicrobiota bacterium]